MKTTAPVAALCGILLAASLPTTEAAQIISIDFNQTGTAATNAGSLGGNYNVTLKNNGGTPTDLHSADGTGVSGLAGDRAFDLTSATGMNLAGPYANFVSETHSDLAPLGALTLAGWYKVANGADFNGAYVIRNNSDTPVFGGWSVNFTSVGRMQFTVGNGTSSPVVNSSNNAFTSNGGNWVFFAVSWNGSNATFYNGTVAGSATAVGSPAFSQTMVVDSQAASIGRSNLTTGALDGLLDDFKIYNTALDATQIEAVRVSAIPEPSTFALLAASFGALLFWRKRSARA